jgi:methyl-accepting chemotaxis protein
MTIFQTIKGKLILAFVTIIILAVGSGIASYVSMSTVNSRYQYLVYGGSVRVRLVAEMQTQSALIDSAIERMLYNVGDASIINSSVAQKNAAVQRQTSLAQEYMQNLNNDNSLAQENYDMLYRTINDFLIASGRVIDLGESVAAYSRETNRAAIGNLIQNFDTLQQERVAISTFLSEFGIERVSDITEEIVTFSDMWTVIILILSITVALISVAFALVTFNAINKPIKALSKDAMKIAEGDFNVQLRSNKRDEMSQLSNTIADMIDPLVHLIEDLADFKAKAADGGLTMRIDESTYRGDYLQSVKAINESFDILVNDNMALLKVFEEYVDGNFEATLEQMHGESLVFNEVATKMQDELKAVYTDINNIIQSAQKGDLAYRLDTSTHHGDWAKLMRGLNNILETVSLPLSESSEVLSQIAVGNLAVSVKGSYQGEFSKMAGSINDTVNALNSYIGEIDDVLGSVSKKDLTTKITRDYLGDFNSIKSSINNIIVTLNQIIEEIDSSSTQIATGVTHISDTSMGLAQGSTEQSSSVESLNQLISAMLDQVNTTSENANITNKLAEDAKESANTGNQDMQEMLVSMEEINESSENIAKIIKVIDDIAFQTNLLALNAAVEAARAGEHGRGFAVVAEEVRALAQRSKNAAAETTTLIETSIQKTGAGSKIANQTASALNQIVNQINDISERIGAVSEASVQQVDSINNISSSISQISQVTQANTATAEESASVTEELSSQTETFRAMVSEFKLSR